MSDDTLVRSLRYGISRHGDPLLPIMPFADLADDDLQAVLSFVRTLPPVPQPASTGVLHRSTEQEFIDRFRIKGRGLARSPMPWEAFARMTDTDLGAIYRYLQTLPPAEASKGEAARSASLQRVRDAGASQTP